MGLSLYIYMLLHIYIHISTHELVSLILQEELNQLINSLIDWLSLGKHSAGCRSGGSLWKSAWTSCSWSPWKSLELMASKEAVLYKGTFTRRMPIYRLPPVPPSPCVIWDPLIHFWSLSISIVIIIIDLYCWSYVFCCCWLACDES